MIPTAAGKHVLKPANTFQFNNLENNTNYKRQKDMSKRTTAATGI